MKKGELKSEKMAESRRRRYAAGTHLVDERKNRGFWEEGRGNRLSEGGKGDRLLFVTEDRPTKKTACSYYFLIT